MTSYRTWDAAVTVALAATALTGLVACAGVPAGLQAAPGLRPLMTVAATGVQVYECRGSGPAAPGWTFVAPDAELFDAQGRFIGRHGAGPHWVANDGSRIVGSVSARAEAPAAGAIPWLLLATHSTGATGRFSPVAQIQRVNTEGGIAPDTGCSSASLGQQRRVPYRADYRLFVPA